MKLDLIGVPEHLSNASEETIPGGSATPISNGSPNPPASPFLTPQQAHEALLELAQSDGWQALYDPTNESSLIFEEGTSNVAGIRDSLGNLPDLLWIEGDGVGSPSPVAPLGSLRGFSTPVGGGFGVPMDLFIMGVDKYPSAPAPVRYLFVGGPSLAELGPLLFRVGTAAVTSYTSPQIQKDYDFPFPAQDESFVWGFDSLTGDLYAGRHFVTPDSDGVSPLPLGRPTGILYNFDPEGLGVAGPLVVGSGNIQEDVRLRMVELLETLSGSPSTLRTEEAHQFNGYANAREDGTLTAAFRPDRPGLIASMTKLLTALIVAENVNVGQLDDLITVVPPFMPTDNRFPAVYPGDQISWRDAVAVTLSVSHNRLPSTLAHHVGLILSPGSPTPIEVFIGEMNAKAQALGWSEAVFTNPVGHYPNTLSARHTAELGHLVKEYPWLLEALGAEHWDFTILRGGEVDPGTTYTGTTTAIVRKNVGGQYFPESLGGKGGHNIVDSISNYSVTFIWRNPASGEIEVASLVNSGGGTVNNRYENARALLDSARNTVGPPRGWSSPDNNTWVAWGRDGSRNFVSSSRSPESNSPIVELIPFDTLSEPFPVVPKDSEVTLSVWVRVPYSAGEGSTRSVSLDLSGGVFVGAGTRIIDSAPGSSSFAWTKVTLTGTVQRGGILTPRIFIDGGDANATVWASAATLTIDTPDRTQWVYSMQVSDYSITEESQPLDLTSPGGSVGGFSAAVLRPELDSVFSEYGHRYLYGKRVRLTSRYGDHYGMVVDVGMSDLSAVSIEAQSDLGTLNAFNVSAPPYSGNLQGLLQTYLGLLGGAAPSLTLDPEISGREVLATSWTGDLWDRIKQLCAAEKIQVSSGDQGGVHFAPAPRGEVTIPEVSSVIESGNPSTLAESVEVVLYSRKRIENSLVYPPGGWNPDVEVISVRPGDTVQYSLELGASLESFTTPRQVDSVAPNAVGDSVFSITDNEGELVTPDRWVASGGHISFRLAPSRREIIMSITAPARILKDDIRNFVNAYFIGAPFGSSNQAFATVGEADSLYSTLRILGTGVTESSKVLKFPTGVPQEATGTPVGVTIDNPFISSMSQAAEVGTRAALTFSGSRAEVTYHTQTPPEVGALIKGSYLDYRQRSTALTPSGTRVSAEYHLTYDVNHEILGGGTYDQVTEQQDGLSYFDSQNRGKRYDG